MKKLSIFLLSILLLLTVIGYFGYQFALSYASDKVIEHVVNDLLDDQLVEEILSDPAVEELVSELVNADAKKQTSKRLEELPIKTKEEGVKVVLDKFSVSEIAELATQAQGGLTDEKKMQLGAQLQERLTEEEIEALMIIGIAELQKELLKE